MANAMQKAQAKFKTNQKINFTLGRGGRYSGKVIGFEEDGYLTVAYNGKRKSTENLTFTRRISPANAKVART